MGIDRYFRHTRELFELGFPQRARRVLVAGGFNDTAEYPFAAVSEIKTKHAELKLEFLLGNTDEVTEVIVDDQAIGEIVTTSDKMSLLVGIMPFDREMIVPEVEFEDLNIGAFAILAAINDELDGGSK